MTRYPKLEGQRYNGGLSYYNRVRHIEVISVLENLLGKHVVLDMTPLVFDCIQRTDRDSTHARTVLNWFRYRWGAPVSIVNRVFKKTVFAVHGRLHVGSEQMIEKMLSKFK